MKKLYHIVTGANDEKLKDILTNGLKCHDNGEVGNCIWFSVGEPFYKDSATMPLILSLDCSDENISKYRLDTFDIDNNSAATFVRDDIPLSDLNIEQLFFGRLYRSNNPERAIMQLCNTRVFNSFDKARRWDSDISLVLYEDLFNMWARKDMEDKGGNVDIEHLREILGDRLTVTNFLDTPVFESRLKTIGLTPLEYNTVLDLYKACF